MAMRGASRAGEQAGLSGVLIAEQSRLDEMQISHSSASFLLSLCAPVSNLKRFSLLTPGPHADRRAHGSLQPLLQFSVFPSVSQNSVRPLQGDTASSLQGKRQKLMLAAPHTSSQYKVKILHK